MNCSCTWGLFRDRNVTLRKPVRIIYRATILVVLKCQHCWVKASSELFSISNAYFIFTIGSTTFSCAYPYDPETNTNIELGIKGDFMEGRLRLNVSIFNTEFEDLQRNQVLPLPIKVI